MARRLISAMVRMRGGPTLGGSFTRLHVYDDEALTTPSELFQRGTGVGEQPNPLNPNAGRPTTLTADRDTLDDYVIVASVAGFQVGDLIPVYDDTNTVYRVITSIVGATKRLNLDQALGFDFASGSNVNNPDMRGHVWFYLDDAADKYAQTEDVASGRVLPPMNFPVRVPTSTVAFQEEAAAVASRGIVNYIGRSITAADDVVNSRVNVTVGIGGTEAAPSPEVLTDTDTGLWGEGGDILSIVAGAKRVAQFIGVASAVNYVELTNAATGVAPVIKATGADAVVQLLLQAKAITASVLLRAGVTGNLLLAQSVTSAVNYVTVTNAATSANPALAAAGTDANITLNLSGKGTGSVNLAAHLTDYLQITSGGAGYTRWLAVGAGSDTNIQVSSKGAGAIQFFAGSVGRFLLDLIDAATSAVNYLRITNAVTGVAPHLSAQGTDAVIDIDIIAKGATGRVLGRGFPIVLTYSKVTSSTTVVNTTTETTIYGQTITGGHMGPNGMLRLRLSGDYLNDTGLSPTGTFRVKFGATTIFTGTTSPHSQSTARKGWHLEFRIWNVAATGSQRADGWWRIAGATATPFLDDLGGAWHEGQAGAGTSTEATTADKGLIVTFQHSIANASIDIVARQAHLELVQ